MKNIIKQVILEYTKTKLQEQGSVIGGKGEEFKIEPKFYTSGQSDVTPEIAQQLVSTNIPNIITYLNKTPDNIVSFNIISSESKVPNNAPFQTPGSLALARANALKTFLQEKLKNYSSQIKFNVSSKIGGDPWDGKDKNAEKYTKHQYSTVSYVTTPEKRKSNITLKTSTFCSTKQIKGSGTSAPAPNFLGYSKSNEVGYEPGQVNFSLFPYMYPDRLIATTGNNKIDTGYVVGNETASGMISLVLNLSANYQNNQTSPAFEGIDTIIDVSQTESSAVLKIITDEMKKQGLPPSDSNSKTTIDYINNYVGKGKSIQKIVYYKKLTAQPKLIKDNSSAFVNVNIYSPVDKSIYDIRYQCFAKDASGKLVAV